MRSDDDGLVRLGVVTGTHGLRGDLKVRPLTPDAKVLLDVSEVFTATGPAIAARHRLRRASEHKGHILLRLDGVDDIDAAQSLRGADVLVPRSVLDSSSEEDRYWVELQGAVVVDRRFGEIGTLEDVFTTAAHDVYVVQGRYGEVLIPAVDAFIEEFDRENRRLMVDLPEGLVAEPDDV